MQIKNRKKLIIICLLNLLLFKLNVNAEEFNISAKEIFIDKINEIVIGKGSVVAEDSEGKRIYADKITYKKPKEFLLAEGKVKITDNDGNIIETSMFQYNVKNNLFSSIGKIKVVDIRKNKYFFKELYVDTKKKEIIGSDVSVVLDQTSFGVSKESDPRFVA